MQETFEAWEGVRQTLLSRRISDLGLSIRGTLVERLVEELYSELAQRGLALRPPVYLSDQWGCPEGTPLIGVPFYLADPRLSRLEEEMAAEVEGELEVMRYLRHESGHAFNYAYHLYEREDWRSTFGRYTRPYRERYQVDPLSRDYVRHILCWYAQKHPDEDFAETFAVWLTPGREWRSEYAGWPALAKLEYVERVMAEVGREAPTSPTLTADDLPVEAMDYTLGDHYQTVDQRLPITDERQFDGELRSLFGVASEAPAGEGAGDFLRRHRREIVSRISYWTGESTTVARSFIDHLARRADALELRVRGLEASTLIELTAFGTAVIMNFRHQSSRGRQRRPERS
ncbi:MAG: putative zinc-binding metallopeptidase [Gemmatimonadota bacterium]|nr:putative zinc-binding metallopeptidase [Gemmatimonadota bacterium]